MRVRLNYSLIVITSAILLFGMVNIRSFADTRVQARATVTAVTGEVYVGNLPSVGAGTLIELGSALRTSNNGTITFSVANKILLELYPDTTMKYINDENTGRVSFELTHGTVSIRRVGNDLESSRLSIITPQVIAFLRGTTTSAAIVAIPDSSHTNLFVTEGRANLRGRDSDENANGVSLPVGNMTTIDETVSASDPRPYAKSELPYNSIVVKKTEESFPWWGFGLIAILGIATGSWFARHRGRVV